MNWKIVVAAALPSLLSGTEIGLITAGAANERGWGKAWLPTLAGLATMFPLTAIHHLLFTHLPRDLMEYLAGAMVFGLYFAIKGLRKRGKKAETESKEEGFSGGLAASYAGVVGEGLEMPTVVTVMGAEAGHAFFSAWAGEAFRRGPGKLWGLERFFSSLCSSGAFSKAYRDGHFSLLSASS